MSNFLPNTLPLIIALSTGIVYAENTYFKKSDFKEYTIEIRRNLSKNRIDEIQEVIDYLNQKKINNRISDDERWRLQYLVDKKNNLLRELG